MVASPANDKVGFSAKLLKWYDRSARDLPWRVRPCAREAGAKVDPYRVWLSEVMLQQTTVATVTPRFETFLARWPTVGDLAAAPIDDVLGAWAGLGYYARARNLHACAVQVAEAFDGKFPGTEAELLALPGIGPYTAAAIAAIAFDQPATVVDGNVDRVVVRLFNIHQPIREVKPQIRAHAEDLTPRLRSGDYAQAMMDLGATICRPKTPDCLICPVQPYCDANSNGSAAELPVRPVKTKRPTRYGHVFVGIGPNGHVLTERRPPKGLFGGMAGLPGTEWAETAPISKPPYDAAWRDAGEIEHVLSHFRLVLTVHWAPIRTVRPGLSWTDDLSVLPTVFRKAVACAVDAAAA